MAKLYRAQILLEPEQHSTLTEIAQADGRSVSDLVREIVGQYLVEREIETKTQRAMRALERLARIRTRISEQHGVYQGDLIAKAREEREQDIERVWRGEP